ncbi:Cupredoxin [Lipomyces oligophaga]|uniref:Cupredoxin n=1 Tax=Lipomyces oligophaga TaxID=45792 RepID=UPI0034CDA982
MLTFRSTRFKYSLWVCVISLWQHERVQSISISVVTQVSNSVLALHKPEISKSPMVNDQIQASAEEIRALISRRRPITHEFDWHIKSAEFSPDGVVREMFLVNNIFPGPVIRAKRGDRIRIRVHNELDVFNQSTSLHFHGLYQRGTNVMDGVPGVTQCGIPIHDENFVYDFNLTQSGSFWWHSHSKTQRIDGIMGGLIVYDSEERYQIDRDYDEEIYLILHDHYHETGANMFDWYLSRESAGFEPVPDSGLINGQGTVDCERAKRKYECHSDSTKRPKFKFQHGKKYRLRILNASAFAELTFSIDDHVLDIIEADSIEVQRYPVHMLTIAPGQRYSAIVTAASGFSAVVMRIQMQTSCFQYRPRVLDKNFDTVVEYQEEKSILTKFSQKFSRRNDVKDESELLPEDLYSIPWEDAIPAEECEDLDTSKLVPVESMIVPNRTMRIFMEPKNMNLDRVEQANYGFINRTSFQPAIGAPNIQVAFNMVNAEETVHIPTVSGRENTKFWGGEQLVSEIPYGAVVDLVLHNSDDTSHPFHLHGHDFWVLREYRELVAGAGRWHEQFESEYRLDNPIRRDTVTVPLRGHVVIRFVADNPGIWAFHCHIVWHLGAGMMMQFATGLDHFNSRTISPVMKSHCEVERELGQRLLRPLPGEELRQKIKHNKELAKGSSLSRL